MIFIKLQTLFQGLKYIYLSLSIFGYTKYVRCNLYQRAKPMELVQKGVEYENLEN